MRTTQRSPKSRMSTEHPPGRSYRVWDNRCGVNDCAGGQWWTVTVRVREQRVHTSQLVTSLSERATTRDQVAVSVLRVRDSELLSLWLLMSSFKEPLWDVIYPVGIVSSTVRNVDP